MIVVGLMLPTLWANFKLILNELTSAACDTYNNELQEAVLNFPPQLFKCNPIIIFSLKLINLFTNYLCVCGGGGVVRVIEGVCVCVLVPVCVLLPVCVYV